jgi:hypothetical protein
VTKKRTKNLPKKSGKVEKRVDLTSYLTGRRRGAVVKEEVWYDGTEMVKYSLAYVNPRICAVDNGRVLGYDNSHGYHHRHFKGTTKDIEFTGYEALLEQFEKEVQQL